MHALVPRNRPPPVAQNAEDALKCFVGCFSLSAPLRGHLELGIVARRIGDVQKRQTARVLDHPLRRSENHGEPRQPGKALHDPREPVLVHDQHRGLEHPFCRPSRCSQSSREICDAVVNVTATPTSVGRLPFLDVRRQRLRAPSSRPPLSVFSQFTWPFGGHRRSARRWRGWTARGEDQLGTAVLVRIDEDQHSDPCAANATPRGARFLDRDPGIASLPGRSCPEDVCRW